MNAALDIANLTKQLDATEDKWERYRIEKQIDELKGGIQKQADSEVATKKELEEKAAKEKQAQQEKKDREAKEAKEKAEKEAKEKAQKTENEKKEKDRQEKEHKEKQEREKAEREKSEKEKSSKENSIEGGADGKANKEHLHDHGEREQVRTLSDAQLRKMYPHADLAQANMSPAMREVWQQSEVLKYQAHMKELAEKEGTQAPAEKQNSQSTQQQANSRVMPSGVEAENVTKPEDLQKAQAERNEAVEQKERAEYSAEAKQEHPREMEEGERISGEIVDSYEKDGKEYYEVETYDGEKVGVPKEAAEEYEKGGEVTVERTDKGYEVEEERSYGR